MHSTAMTNGQHFFDTYSARLDGEGRTVVEVGSQNVNGSLRDICPSRFSYIGLDFAEGHGVDIVLDDPYQLPLPNGSVDIVVASSCFEHAEFFWLTYLEVMRILRPEGLFYLNAPSAGSFHRYPVDCWRFYPDSGAALVNWGIRNGIPCVLVESFIHEGGSWQDFVAVILRDEQHLSRYPERIIDSRTNFQNARSAGVDEIRNAIDLCQNEQKLLAIHSIARIEH